MQRCGWLLDVRSYSLAAAREVVSVAARIGGSGVAIYHLNISVVSRSRGESAVAGSAYLSRSKMVSERDGVTHDYRHAHQHEELVADLGVALPDRAPARWSDRLALWNEVERIERKSDAQLARRIECALPDELPEDEQIALAKRIVADRVADGHVVDACIHRNKNGTNTHLHMLEPLRRCDAGGFMPKSENVYTVRRPLGAEVWGDGFIEREREKVVGAATKEVSAAEFKELKERGYEKVFKYRRGNEWRQLTVTEATYEVHSAFKRHGKTPVQRTRYLNNGWNEQARAEEWREAVARRTNEALERAGMSSRVDHRSYERQGVDRVAQLHEGSKVRAMEERAKKVARARGTTYVPATGVRSENVERAAVNERIERAKATLLDAMRKLAISLRATDGISRARVSLARSWNSPELAFGGGTRVTLVESARRWEAHQLLQSEEARGVKELAAALDRVLKSFRSPEEARGNASKSPDEAKAAKEADAALGAGAEERKAIRKVTQREGREDERARRGTTDANDYSLGSMLGELAGGARALGASRAASRDDDWDWVR